MHHCKIHSPRLHDEETFFRPNSRESQPFQKNRFMNDKNFNSNNCRYSKKYKVLIFTDTQDNITLSI